MLLMRQKWSSGVRRVKPTSAQLGNVKSVKARVHQQMSLVDGGLVSAPHNAGSYMYIVYL